MSFRHADRKETLQIEDVASARGQRKIKRIVVKNLFSPGVGQNWEDLE